MEPDETKKEMTREEERELRRVFDYLSNFAPLNRLYKRLNPYKERLAKINAHRKNPNAVKILDSSGTAKSEAAIDEEYQQLLQRIHEVESEIATFDSPDKKVHTQDLSEALRFFGKRCTRQEIQDMIWEVDENLDGAVDWEEFQLMFQRNVTDRTGLEPNSLFHIVQFMMYDQSNTGRVSLDETMSMLFARYGKARLEEKMKSLFGDKTTITLSEYLEAVQPPTSSQSRPRRSGRGSSMPSSRTRK